MSASITSTSPPRRNAPITVTHTPVLSDAVADLTLALILMTARRLGEAVDIVANGGWDDALLGADLRSKTLLIVGFGRIGREVAQRALGFKMHVCAYDARAEVPEVAGVERVATLVDGLARADVVSLHVDLNPTTRHLIDAAAFAVMKPTAFLINTSRGGVVDQAALTSALAEHRIGGAGLDVLEIEPPDAGEPLLAMPNVVVLPHIGSATVETRRAMLDCAVDNLVACLRGEKCENTTLVTASARSELRTANTSHSPGTASNERRPRGVSSVVVPITRSRMVWDTSTSPGSARAASCRVRSTAMPCARLWISRHSPLCTATPNSLRVRADLRRECEGTADRPGRAVEHRQSGVRERGPTAASDDVVDVLRETRSEVRRRDGEQSCQHVIDIRAGDRPGDERIDLSGDVVDHI